MKPFISRIKDLSQKAAEIKAAIQQVPPKVVEIREAMAATTGQLQQLKSEIHYSVTDLKADNEDRLIRALEEIKNSADVFAKAGFVVTGLDFEISPVQRMLVKLSKAEDVHVSVLRSLLNSTQSRKTIHATLSAILQAKQMADTVEFEELDYSELAVGIGPIPTVRLRWRLKEEDVQISTPAPISSSATNPPVTATAPITQPQPQKLSPFGTSSFFERREPVLPAAAPQVEPPVAAPVESVIATTPTVAPEAELTKSDKPSDPLARFKKMPVLSR